MMALADDAWSWENVYGIAAAAGCDPHGDYTLRELVWLAKHRQRYFWAPFRAILALFGVKQEEDN